MYSPFVDASPLLEARPIAETSSNRCALRPPASFAPVSLTCQLTQAGLSVVNEPGGKRQAGGPTPGPNHPSLCFTPGGASGRPGKTCEKGVTLSSEARG